MYQGKHSRSAVLAERQRRRKNKAMAAFASLALVGVLAVGGTVAFLVTNSVRVNNAFSSSEVSCAVDENFSDTVKEDVRIENTGDTAAYIRAEVLVNWVKENEDGTVDVYGDPVDSGDYEISPAEAGWIYGADGYWYWNDIVPVGGFTGELIPYCKPLKSAPAEGYTLGVEIICSAVQADGVKVVDGKEIPAVVDAWDNDSIVLSVNDDGTLSVPSTIKE